MGRRPQDNLTKLYNDWYVKSQEQIEYENNVCVEKSTNALKLLKGLDIAPIKSVLEIGCGYGRNLDEIVNHTNAHYGLGCDISKEAIEYAKKHYENDSVRFFYAESPEIKSTVSQIQREYEKPFDIVILFDVLEHIPQAKTFIRELARVSRYFLIILPLDNTVLQNYILPKKMKKFPGSNHPDGHLREFHVNNVHQFVVSLGLTPLAYNVYKFSQYDQFPPHKEPRSLKGKMYFKSMKAFTLIVSKLLPQRIFLRLVGMGGFVCMATYDPDFVLE